MSKRKHIKSMYRSGLELENAKYLELNGVDVVYESKESVIKYTKPESNHRYTPDFVLPNGIIIETKGRLVAADRMKHLLIKKQHPELDIRFVFTRSKAKLYKGSQTTYGDWAKKNGFKYADKLIPKEWIDE